MHPRMTFLCVVCVAATTLEGHQSERRTPLSLSRRKWRREQ